MLDLQEKFRDLEVRVSALEQATLSGVPGMSIVDRFSALHDRVDDVAKNILDKIGKEVGEVRAEMKTGFAKVDERFNAVDERFNAVDERFNEVDNRLALVESGLDSLKSNVFDVMTEVSIINRDSKRRDLRIDKLEKQLETQHEILLVHDERFDRIESLLVRIESKLPDQQPN